jgi:hypothetical protein
VNVAAKESDLQSYSWTVIAQMRLPYLFLLLLWSAGVALSAQPATSKFDKYRSRHPTIDLDDTKYEELTSSPRDYHIAVILTATDSRYNCGVCREFQGEWERLARSWHKGSKPDGIKLLFGTLDFDNGKGTFQKVCTICSPLTCNLLTSDKAYATICPCPPLISADCRSLRPSRWITS